MQGRSMTLTPHEVDSAQQLLVHNTKALTTLQEVLRKDNRDVAILAEAQQSKGLALMVT